MHRTSGFTATLAIMTALFVGLSAIYALWNGGFGPGYWKVAATFGVLAAMGAALRVISGLGVARSAEKARSHAGDGL